jgi:RNase P subunit RPR2
MSMICHSCKTGLLVFLQTGSVRHPEAKIFRCSHCGNIVTR